MIIKFGDTSFDLLKIILPIDYILVGKNKKIEVVNVENVQN